MSKKEEKSREYADWLHKNLEEQLGHKCAPHDMYYRRGDILQAFEVGWDEAINYLHSLSVREAIEVICKEKKGD